MKTKQLAGQIARISTLGGLLGIKTSALLPRLSPVSAACDEEMIVTVNHAFDSISVTTHVERALAREVCGAWLDELPGERLAVEIDANTNGAWSDEAALPDTAPPAVRDLAADVDMIGGDGATWTYVVGLDNGDEAAMSATLARIDTLAAQVGVTEAQRRVVANLHQGLAREMTNRLWLRARDGALESVMGVVWDRVEWAPIQSMLKGFFPTGGGVDKIARLARNTDAETATVELVLGPQDPPAMRFSFELR